MQKEGVTWWKRKGYAFEELKPSVEMKTPSEWWIPVYAIRHLFQKIRGGRYVNEMGTTSDSV
jgi:hypothetical protein